MKPTKGKSFIKGLHNFECQICRRWYKSDEKRIRWDRLITCKRCWDPKPWFLLPPPAVIDLRPVPKPSPPSTSPDGTEFG